MLKETKNIKRLESNYKVVGVKMATVSFEKNIALDNKSINKLVAVVSKQEHNELKKMNTLNKIERGRLLLNKVCKSL